MLHEYVGKRPLSVPDAGFLVTNVRWADKRMIEPGDVIRSYPGFNDDHWRELPDPADHKDKPLGLRCQLCEVLVKILPWSCSDAKVFDGNPLPFIDAKSIIKEQLPQLIEAALDLGVGDLSDIDTAPLNKLEARIALRKLRQMADAENAAVSAEAEPAVGMTWQEAAERLERRRKQGEPFTSQSKLAKDFGCSSGTINKAIRSKPELKAWAKRDVTPKAQSLTPHSKRGDGWIDPVTDAKAQSREPSPAEEAAIREYLERDLTPEERAFFNGLSRENQLAFLDDPDKHVKILGRKP